MRQTSACAGLGLLGLCVLPAAAGQIGDELLSKFRDCDTCPEMVVIPAGTFRMGCGSDSACPASEVPVHTVTIAQPFAISTYEVTFEEYERYLTATGGRRPDDHGWGRGRQPIFNVSWENARDYARWLSGETGALYRLPSEAEWEYAGRAGTATAYSWGNEIRNNRANCDGCGSQWDEEMTAPVGSFGANAWGLHDMHGNVWEWVQDCLHDDYAGAPGDASAWEFGGDCEWRVMRGGSWGTDPELIRSAFRTWMEVRARSSFIGFRVARTLD